MRKLPFFIVIALCGTAATAQNVATTSTTGDGNNTAISQTGAGHSAEITVYGDNNGNSGAAAPGDDITIRQSAGDNNSGTIKIGSSGDDANYNDADIAQVGAGNSATIKMDYYNDGNIAATGNDIDILQTGDNNKASVNPLKGADNMVSIDQAGDASWHIVQTFGSDNDIDIYASGNGNRGAWKILQGGSDNEVNVDQLGDRNRASGHIKNGDNNKVVVLQDGDDNHINSVSGWQTPGLTIIDGDWNEAYLTQAGDDNIYNASQTGDYHNLTLDVTGDNNEFDASQAGNAGGLAAEGNIIDVLVDGDFNKGTLSQDGTLNSADVDITGNNNSLTVSQTGDMNAATIMQDGSGHIGDITQTGNGNTATINQSN